MIILGDGNLVKEYIIDNISEYLELIREKKFHNYIFRGQNQAFTGIQASGFRTYKGGWGTNQFYDIKEMKRQFFNKVVRKISNDEKKFFLAFCQHHGLPTNLVDFTTSPLIALFFACYGKEKPKENILIDDAEIYLIKKEKLLDITDMIAEFNNKDFFESLLVNEEIRKKTLFKLEQLFTTQSDIALIYLNRLIDCYENNNINIHGESLTELDEEAREIVEEGDYYLNKLSDFKNKNEISELYDYLLNEIDDESITYGETYRLESFIYYSTEEVIARVYLALLINLLQIQFDCGDQQLNLDFDMYFTYQPPDLFDRIVNQKGLFIYQPYLSKTDEQYQFTVLSYQSINPDYTLRIRNHHEILNELNFLGINLESIYGDFDNIAKSVKFNHDYTFKQ